MMKKPRKLRWQLALSMSGAVLLLWGLLMVLFTQSTAQNIKNQANEMRSFAEDGIDEQWGFYKRNSAEGIEDTVAILRENLSGLSMGLTGTEGLDGGMALCFLDEKGKEITRSQLAFGYGHVEGIDRGKRWFLELDSGLDDAGQLALARWLIEHRTTGDFRIYPADASHSPGDGTIARVTGLDRGGGSLSVQHIELVHPDGSVETVVETSTGGDNAVVLDFTFFKLTSVLLPNLWMGGNEPRNGYTDMEFRLANFRKSQAMIDSRLAENETAAQKGSGIYYSSLYDDGLGSLIAQQYSSERTAIYQMRPFYIISFVLAALLLLGLSSYLSYKLVRPLENLSEAAGAGRPCCDRGSIVEVNALAAAFNAAQGKMASDLKREQELTRAVAHELKTPLAILRSHAEALSEDIAPAKREQYLNIIMDESDRMAALVGELLDLSRMEAGAEQLNREVVDFRALTERVFARIAELTHVSLALESIFVSGDPKLLERAVSNYASNALRHCVEGGEIRVTLRREGGNAVLTVENDGEQIPPEALAHIWDTFYKADTARTRGSGSGLGLAIVRSIAALHGGSCAAENRPGAVAFTLSLSCIPTDSVV